MQREGALPLWTWAREFWAVCVRSAGVLPKGGSSRRRQTAPGGLSLAEIGVRLAHAEGRRRAYSDSWVSNALNTAEQWPSPPLTPAEARMFLDRIRGHRQRPRGARRTTTVVGVERRLRAATTDGVRLGMRPRRLLRVVWAALRAATQGSSLAQGTGTADGRPDAGGARHRASADGRRGAGSKPETPGGA